jgi:pimeloyl-ACP methyl ester carboxylesterase
VAAPALLVLASESEYLQRLQADGDAASLASAFPATTLVTLAGLGHMMHHEDPAAVAASIVAWSKD